MSQVTRTERVKAFLFLLIGLVVIGSVVLTLLHLRKPPRTYFLQFRETVSGLEEGAPVRYKGVKYGKVAKIRVDEDDLETITVELALDEDAPIRVSTVAEIATESIVSKYHIELQGSRLTSPELPEESCIRTRASTLQELLATGETIADSVYGVLDNLAEWTDEEHKVRFFDVLDKIDQTAEAAKQTLNLVNSTFEKGGDGARLLNDAANFFNRADHFLQTNESDFKKALTSVTETAKSLDSLINSEAFQNDVKKLGEAADEVTLTGKTLRESLVGANKKDGGLVGRVMTEVESAVESVERLEKRLTAALGTLSVATDEAMRTGVTPALRELGKTAAALGRLIELIERQPGALFFGPTPAKKPLPGGGKR